MNVRCEKLCTTWRPAVILLAKYSKWTLIQLHYYFNILQHDMTVRAVMLMMLEVLCLILKTAHLSSHGFSLYCVTRIPFKLWQIWSVTNRVNTVSYPSVWYSLLHLCISYFGVSSVCHSPYLLCFQLLFSLIPFRKSIHPSIHPTIHTSIHPSS